jgi:6-phospho-beta-glucosidase
VYDADEPAVKVDAMGVKVAVVGGGSTYTPELVEGFVTRGERLPVDELVLLDIDAERLGIVGALAERMMRRAGWGGRLTLTQDRLEAIDGADFVIVQLRVGQQAARYRDETIPPRHGCIGQETTGPGGFAKALRTVPVVLELAELTAERGASGAWFVDFTNPTGLVTQALLDAGHRAIGLCNVAIGFQRRFAQHFGVEPERVQLEHVGLNHLTWERKVLVDGVDRLPEILEDAIDLVADETDMPAELIRSIGAIPSYYLHYYYLANRVIEHQKTSRTRAEEVMEIEAGLLELYRDPALDTKPKLLEERGGAFYSDAAAALVASLHADTGDVQVVNIRNDGAIPDLADDDVVEIAATIDRDGAHPLSVAGLSPDMLGLVQHAKAYERLTIEAAMSGDRDVALRALMTNPLVRDFDVAVPLLEELLEADRDLLPRFYPVS